MSNKDELIENKIKVIENKDIKLLAEITYLSAKLIEQKLRELIHRNP